MINIENSILFHGHLGPYLILGEKAGIKSLDVLKAKKYFGIKIIVHCPDIPPHRCIIDGIQLSSGATFGKGNILHIPDNQICIKAQNTQTDDILEIRIQNDILRRIESCRDESDAEELAKKFAQMPDNELFNMNPSK